MIKLNKDKVKERYASRMSKLLQQFYELNDLSRKYNEDLTVEEKNKIIEVLESQLKSARNNLFKETQTIINFHF